MRFISSETNVLLAPCRISAPTPAFAKAAVEAVSETVKAQARLYMSRSSRFTQNPSPATFARCMIPRI